MTVVSGCALPSRYRSIAAFSLKPYPVTVTSPPIPTELGATNIHGPTVYLPRNICSGSSVPLESETVMYASYVPTARSGKLTFVAVKFPLPAMPMIWWEAMTLNCPSCRLNSMEFSAIEPFSTKPAPRMVTLPALPSLVMSGVASSGITTMSAITLNEAVALMTSPEVLLV